MLNMHPLVILAIGTLTVVLMITLLRMNAFIALIASAIVVSLLAPGSLDEKISRVAMEFGHTAAGIGIVIALAVVIGRCMMDSSAADRIDQGFLALLGEKRSSTALMASGFVLSVPVFFDTVFYLLVPLARSMHRRAGKHYLKYAMAIVAGGVITHCLVPPTPGPLIMMENLGIDIGIMIMVGALVSLPAAGGAFGVMLKEAQIGPAIENLFKGNASQPTNGLILLGLGALIAAVMKIAQGSCTVAMITASAMIAVMVPSAKTLGYHPVYLATAIGGGSMIGSWMNDSGFWIFVKMMGLTETEGLKSWTPLLAIVGLTAVVVSFLFAIVMPIS